MQFLKDYFVVFFLFFLFIGLNSASSLNNNIPDSLVRQESTQVHFSELNTTEHIPFSIPVPAEPSFRVNNNNNSKDNHEDEPSELGSSCLLNDLIIIDYNKSTVLSFILSIQNRQTVSLYILHHCWKNYLS